MSKKGRKMPADTDAILKDLSEQLKNLNAAVQELKKKVDGDKASDKDGDLSDLAALLPLFGFMPLGFGGSLLFPLSLRLGAARALALGQALERAAKVLGSHGKERDGTPEVVGQIFKKILSEGPDERRILAEFFAKLMAGYRA